MYHPGLWIIKKIYLLSVLYKSSVLNKQLSPCQGILMNTMIERISSAEGGLHDAIRSLLAGFEVHKNDIPFDSFTHKVRPV